MTCPVNPQTSISLSRNAGPANRRVFSLRYTISRFSGLMNARTGTRATIAVSASSTTRDRAGIRGVGQHRDDVETRRRDEHPLQGGQRVQPVGVDTGLLVASRSAVCTGPSSPGSAAPPGKAACPAWCRSVDARTVTSRSASSGSAAGRAHPAGPENSTSTAASRLAPVTAAAVLAAVIVASTSAGTRRR